MREWQRQIYGDDTDTQPPTPTVKPAPGGLLAGCVGAFLATWLALAFIATAGAARYFWTR